jgi:phosphate transport system substrate-binding protein
VVLKGASVADGAHRVAALSDVAQTVAHDRGAIGIAGFNATDPARVLRLIASDGSPVVASSLTIGQKRYPLTMPIYALSRASGSGSPARSFIAFAQSDAGQAIVTGAGFVGRGSF